MRLYIIERMNVSIYVFFFSQITHYVLQHQLQMFEKKCNLFL